ncbi:iron chaperone [Streptomyces sp. NPDC012693]|jgi:uncharacterized protein YdhG (YjbR/CyaY superfamily)|uniref:iron chaperone n=1 Tax=unclassified Streptomyces TaxID=2593676 RepID=UPI00202E9CD0|nr:DUF1801 domain-containing protein [Streptomyces sp. MSC1_001]
MPNTSASSTKSSTAGKSGEKYDGFTEEEREAMKERAKELKASARRDARSAKARAEGDAEVRAKIAEMPEADRVLAERIHEIVAASAPDLAPKLWYGMPSYARDGKVVCFFQSAEKFKTRYATLGFSDLAQLDEGSLWATSFALTELGAAVEARIAALVEKAVS